MRMLREPAASRLLIRMGIDPKRFWLLVDLFGTLSQRRETRNNLGQDRSTLKVVAIIHTVIMALLSLAVVLPQMQVATYLSIFLGMTGLLLFSILIPETSNSLINPVEGLILAHQPINGATYTAAKLTHLLRILLYLVPGPNLIPALMGWKLAGSHWYYPLEHLGAVFTLAIVLASFCCALFGWLLRFVPASRLKGAGQIAEMLPMLVFFTFRYLRGFAANIRIPALMTLGWPMLVAAVGVAGGIVVMGLRSLSGDYLVRVAGIASGRSHGGSGEYSPRRSGGSAFWRLLGGQKARAGFAYLRIMVMRDVQFRRMMIQLLPPLVVMGAVVPAGLKTPPFSSVFSTMHLFPHLFGFLLVSLCYALPHGSYYKGAWIFLTVPSRIFAPFSRGIYSGLWLCGVGVPHLLCLPFLVWSWGVADAAVFVPFSMAVVSLYLGLELRLIEAVPFSKPPRTARGAVAMPVMIMAMAAAGVAVGLQYFLIFHSAATVALSTVVIAVAAYLVTQRSLKSFEVAMQYSLGLDSGEAAPMYKEVAV